MSTKPVLNERRGSLSSVKMCPQCESTRKNAPLLKEVIFSSETKKHYPFLVYPYVSLVSSLHFLLALKKGLLSNCIKSCHTSPSYTSDRCVYTLCEQWHEQLNPEKDHTHMIDVYEPF